MTGFESPAVFVSLVRNARDPRQGLNPWFYLLFGTCQASHEFWTPVARAGPSAATMRHSVVGVLGSYSFIFYL